MTHSVDQIAAGLEVTLIEMVEMFGRDWLDTGMACSPSGRAWAKRANAMISKANRALKAAERAH